jgi:hypothetical protein
MTDILAARPDSLPDAIALIAQLRAELSATRQRLICPRWNMPCPSETLAQLRIAARDGTPATLVDAYMADLDFLKQWNTATGSEARTDAIIAPALAVRRGDALIHGKVDDGDMFLFVFPAGTGDAAMEAKHTALRTGHIAGWEQPYAPPTVSERRAFVKAVCERRYGPEAGTRAYGRYLTGQLEFVDYPTLTIQAFHALPVAGLEQIFWHGDCGIFAAKARER